VRLNYFGQRRSLLGSRECGWMDFVFAYVGPGFYLSLSSYIKGKQVLDITSYIYLDLIILGSHLFLLFPLEPHSPA
jgi:hypothetical protein